MDLAWRAAGTFGIGVGVAVGLFAGMVLAASLVSGAYAGVAAQPGARIDWQPCPKVSGYLAAR